MPGCPGKWPRQGAALLAGTGAGRRGRGDGAFCRRRRTGRPRSGPRSRARRRAQRRL